MTPNCNPVDRKTGCDQDEDCPVDGQICCPTKKVCEIPVDADATACGEGYSWDICLSCVELLSPEAAVEHEQTLKMNPAKYSLIGPL